MAAPIPFFATRNDILGVLRAVSSLNGLAVTEYGLFETPDVCTVPIDRADGLGISNSGDQIHDTTFLVHDLVDRIESSEVPQRNGGVLYSIDQQKNGSTVGLKTGGEWGDSIVIAGQLGLGTGHPRSNELATLILQEMRRQFKKIKSYFVGPEAGRILDSGGRLTVNVGAPREYDLTR